MNAPIQSIDPSGSIDLENTASAVQRLLYSLGFPNPLPDGLEETPHRVARAYVELLEGYAMSPAVILSKRFQEEHDELIVVKDIPFSSLCEHHLLPFSGKVTVGYLPDLEVVGLSKIPRLVRCFSRRLQIQERLTSQIANSLRDHLHAHFVGVYVTAHHQCMSLRGIASAGDMVTSALVGSMRDQLKHEFLGIAQQ